MTTTKIDLSLEFKGLVDDAADAAEKAREAHQFAEDVFGVLNSSPREVLQEIAEILHRRDCGMSHEDMCSWHYEESSIWDGRSNYPTHVRWLRKAAEAVARANVWSEEYLDALKVVTR